MILRTVAALLLGVIAGAALGLYIGWVAWPTEFTDADPTILQEQYRRDYTLMIAAAYSQDGDLDAAQRRLDHLGEANPRAWLLSLTVEMILAARLETDAGRLARQERDIGYLAALAADMGLYSSAMEPYLPAGEGE